jgi:xanthine dehydrogenase YagS FAD-binding subunit
MNREHCIFGASRCVAVNPSDTAPALAVLDAEMVVRGARDERVIAAKDFFLGPAIDITRMTVLQPGELLVAIRLPAKWAGARFYFEKVCDRKAWDFPLMTIASALRLEGERIVEARVAVGAVAPTPLRLEAAEAALRGQPIGEEIAQRAGELAVAGARPLRHNQYKVPLLRNLVRRAVRGQLA